MIVWFLWPIGLTSRGIPGAPDEAQGGMQATVGYFELVPPNGI